ncbi:hypothetical protein [Chryseobacterium gregarium]|uniref:hypothetical protein n=1 Tax=Chryseobacterium gregarium TaxID=456299 RepID=UPI0004069DD0|nr:hypothetical protein [Chryseobacterium gregarium]
MDIVKHIKQHTEHLQKELKNYSAGQRADLKAATLGFYFQLPGYEEVIGRYLGISIDRKQLIDDIYRENVNNYHKVIEKINAETDVYSDDYEEPDPVEIFMLSSFDNAVSGLEKTESSVGLCIGIIDTLDYYENFSNQPAYWNALLEKEVAFQNEMLKALKSQNDYDISVYHKRYHHVEFGEW